MNISQFHYAKGFSLCGNYFTRARVEGFGVLSVRIQGPGFPLVNNGFLMATLALRIDRSA